MNLTGKSITGRRKRNEDSFLVSDSDGRVFVAVSDGMGGHAAGETASRISIEAIERELKQAKTLDEGAIRAAFVAANQDVLAAAYADESLRGMGATLVLAVLMPDSFYAGNVGDSRLYLWHEGAIRQVSHDHSYVAELVRRGIIKPEEAKMHPQRNLITRAIGADDKVKVDLFCEDWQKGDILLLCSDGLSGVLENEQMGAVLSDMPDPDAACAALIDLAYASGSTDNITCVLAKNTEDNA